MASKSFELAVTARAGKSYVPFLEEHLPTAARLARSPVRELSVVLLGDKAISDLHQQFFNDPATTDVITFPIDQDRQGRTLSGELYLCVPMARRQARLRKILVEHELLLYALHGLLHLSGYDDMNEADYKRMHAAEDRILQRLGVGKIFAANVNPGR